MLLPVLDIVACMSYHCVNILVIEALLRSQNAKCKNFINRLYGVLNVVEK